MREKVHRSRRLGLVMSGIRSKIKMGSLTYRDRQRDLEFL